MKTRKPQPFDVVIAMLASGLLAGALIRAAENAPQLARLLGF